VNCRYTARNRALIFSSRLGPTRLVGEAIARAAAPPRVWLQASTATIYAHRHEGDHDEATGVLGGHEPDAPETWRFSIDVATAWERAATEAARACPHTRLGKVGDGRQFVSWIHEEDFVRAVLWLVDHEVLAGAVNLASPNPLPYGAFMRALRRAWGTRLGLPTPRWMLAVGAFFLRTETELVLKSRRVVPGRLLASGFRFRFPTWEAAAQDLCGRRRGSSSAETRLSPVA
jgi:NAD dependent epimerase/dehydratase family enzyme